MHDRVRVLYARGSVFICIYDMVYRDEATNSMKDHLDMEWL